MRIFERLTILIFGVFLGYLLFSSSVFSDKPDVVNNKDDQDESVLIERIGTIDATQNTVAKQEPILKKQTQPFETPSRSIKIDIPEPMIPTVFRDLDSLLVKTVVKNGSEKPIFQFDATALLGTSYVEKSLAISNLTSNASTRESYILADNISQKYYEYKGNDQSNSILNDIKCSDIVCGVLIDVADKSELRLLQQHLHQYEILNFAQTGFFMTGEHENGNYLFYLGMIKED